MRETSGYPVAGCCEEPEEQNRAVQKDECK